MIVSKSKTVLELKNATSICTMSIETASKMAQYEQAIKNLALKIDNGSIDQQTAINNIRRFF